MGTRGFKSQKHVDRLLTPVIGWILNYNPARIGRRDQYGYLA